MVMTSNQVGQMAYAQSAMFGGYQSYAQQITPPYGGAPGMGAGVQGFASGPPPMPPPMPSVSGYGMPSSGSLGQMAMGLHNAPAGSYMPQAFGERMAGIGFGGISAGMGGLSALSGMAGIAGTGMSMLGMGGAAAGGLMMAGSLPVAAGLAAGGYVANQFNTGFQQREQVGNVLRSNFGGMMLGAGGRGGYGFGAQETGQMSTMLREMGTEDMGTNMQELTRVLDMAGQMKLMRGVQSAREFREKFQKTVDSLKEIAQIMNTTLEGAGQFMQQSRSMGFFSGSDIARNLQQTRMTSGMTGMSVGQVQQIQQMGSQMGMSMGMRGRTGAGAARSIAENLGLATQTGVLSDEMMFDATGLTGAEGVQALTARTMQINQKWLRRGAGRVTLAAMWDADTGGINKEMVEKIRSGEISFQEARRIGRRNIAKTGGRRSSFFSQEERIRGMAMEEGGMELAMGMIESHIGGRTGLDLNDPIVQRQMRRRLGMSQSEVEAIAEMRENMPRLNAERRRKSRMLLKEQMRTKSREFSGLQGFQRRMQQMWEREVDAPLQQIADDVTTGLSEVIENFVMDMEGRVRTDVSKLTQERFIKGDIKLTNRKEFASFERQARSAFQTTTGDHGGLGGSIGRLIGTRGPDQLQQLRDLKAFSLHKMDPNMSVEEREEWLNRWQRDITKNLTDYGVASGDQQSLREQASDMIYNSMDEDAREKFIANRSNKAKSFEMAKAQIKLLRKNERLNKIFSRAETDAQRYGILSSLTTGEGGAGMLAVDFNQIGAGGSNQMFFDTLGGADEIIEQRRQRFSELSKKKGPGWSDTLAAVGNMFVRKAGGGGAFGDQGLDELIGGAQKVGNLFFRKVGGGGAFGDQGVGTAELDRFMENDELRADIEASQQVDENGEFTEEARAAQRRIRETAFREEGARAPHQIRADDREELQRILDITVKGTEKQKSALGDIFTADAMRERTIIRSRLKKEASNLQQWTQKNADELRAEMGAESFTQYQKIVDARARGDFADAQEWEEQFYRDNAGKPGAGFLLSRLRESKLGYGFQEALSHTGDYLRQFRGKTDREKSRMLLSSTLGRLGLESDDRRRLLRSGGFMRKVIAGDMTPEELGNQLWNQMSKAQKESLRERGTSKSDFMESVQKEIDIGAGGVQDKELRKRLASGAMLGARQARIEGQPGEEQSAQDQSLTQFKKMNEYLRAILEVQDAGNALLQENTQATREAGSDGGGGGGGDTSTPGTNTTNHR